MPSKNVLINYYDPCSTLGCLLVHFVPILSKVVHVKLVKASMDLRVQKGVILTGYYKDEGVRH